MYSSYLSQIDIQHLVLNSLLCDDLGMPHLIFHSHSPNYLIISIQKVYIDCPEYIMQHPLGSDYTLRDLEFFSSHISVELRHGEAI